MSDHPTADEGAHPTLGPERPPIWERLVELAEHVPEEEIADLPTDLASEHDRYLYEERLAGIEAAFGAAKHLPWSVDDFLREKHEELDREEERFQQQWGAKRRAGEEPR